MSGNCLVLNCEIHKKVFIYVYLQLFKSDFKENYLALTSLKTPLNVVHLLYTQMERHDAKIASTYSDVTIPH